MRIAVLLGGDSDERDVSLVSGCQVADALRQGGHDVVCVDPVKGVVQELGERIILKSGVQALPPDGFVGDGALSPTDLIQYEEIARADVVFSALHGGMGEDGTLQALLDLAGIRYTGSGMLGCALSMDKDVTKRILRDAGIATPDWLVSPTADQVMEGIGVPVIAKPVAGGSSVRLSLLQVEIEVVAAVAEDAKAPSPMMYEAYVEGREFTVGVLGDQVLPVGEIVSTHELFDYECKYQGGMAEEIFPADIPEDLAATLQAQAREVHELLRLREFSRVDFMVDVAGDVWCLEANALPGLTGGSLLPKAARAGGISFPALCDEIVQMAVARES
jgi:D-alanine-D-alanine ligase